MNATYTKPFRVQEQRLIDAEGREVRLWGVNYYLPFSHNYINVRDRGADHLAAIDRDIRDFRLLGVQLVRMHVFDREISDMYGNLVENDHLRVFDYLINQLQANGIYLMITTMAWWNTVENQSLLDKRYAFWEAGQSPAFGFANFCPKHALIWHPQALDCEERYLRGLFTHQNCFSGLRLPEYDNLVVIEVINEPEYPSPKIINRLAAEKHQLALNPIGREEIKLLDLYAAYRQEGQADHSEETANEFCAGLVDRYLTRMFGIVDEYFDGSVLKTHIYYNYKVPAFRRVLQQTTAIDCISLAFYGGNWDGTPSYAPRMLEGDVRKVYTDYQENGIRELGKGLLTYEWAMNCTGTGFDMGAYAQAMTALGVQMASYFTYTPADVAEYNAGWLMQYLNIRHTPRRAAAFAAAGEMFRHLPLGSALPTDPVRWETDHSIVDSSVDLTAYHDDLTYISAGDAAAVTVADSSAAPQRIFGSGHSPYVQHEGNGCYLLERVSADELRLLVLPDQFYVNDPLHGKYFGFANRFIDINKEPVVSRFKELGSSMQIRYPGFDRVRIAKCVEGQLIEVALEATGVFRADPGEYVLRRAGRKQND